MKKAKENNMEALPHGVIGAFAAAVVLAVIESILLYNEVIPESGIIHLVASALAGFVGGIISGKRAGKGPLPVALLTAVLYLILSFLLGQILFDGVGEKMYLTILSVMLGAAAGGILSANHKGTRRKRKTSRR